MNRTALWFPLVALSLVACADTPTTNSDPATNPTSTMPAGTLPNGEDDGASNVPLPSGGGGPMLPMGPTDDGPIIDVDEEDLQCKPKTCEDLNIECGVANDGCEGSVECGGCAAGELCGAGQEPNICLGPPPCTPAGSCAALGFACGIAIDECGEQYDCEAEGRTCRPSESCHGGGDGNPTYCVTGRGGDLGCDVCDALPDCTMAAQPTRLTGRVITAGHADDNVPNQVGVPNAFVYILTNNNPEHLPAFTAGIPTGGTSCDRCDGQDLGPVLVGATTDALGNFTIEGDIPVAKEFLLIVKVGRFRRAVRLELPETAACATSEVERLSTRLPRTMDDGLGVNIPRIAITTGNIDAIECVFHKMGIATSEFANGAAETTGSRIHLYRGGNNGNQGARVGDVAGTPDTQLYGSLERMQSYDMLVADCEGSQWDSSLAQRDANGPNVREYVNRGGRMFASHWSFSWLHENGTTPYAEETFQETGLAGAATWTTTSTNNEGSTALMGGSPSGMGAVSLLGPRPLASPRIQSFADWLVNESVTTAPGYAFNIVDPRNQVLDLGDHVEEFVFRTEGTNENRTQQFSFNTPYGAPDTAVCGRIAYSGFHVAAGGASVGTNVVFPSLCEGEGANDGILTDQEKVLLYMLFDLGSCVGDVPDPPACVPQTCAGADAECGTISDNCGGLLNCGPCPEGQICGLFEPNKCAACTPRTCEEAGVECGFAGDGCGGSLVCHCPEGLQCGYPSAGKCGIPGVSK